MTDLKVRSMTLAAACALLVGCGHPATRAECDEIFDRSAELELRAKNITDPERIKELTSQLRQRKGQELLDRCVGKRITNRVLTCVRSASTSAEVEDCIQ